MSVEQAKELFKGEVVGTEKTAREYLQEGIRFLSKKEIEEDEEMTITKEGQEFEKIPEGIYQAICIGEYDLGNQPNIYSPGDTTPQVLIRWEVDERMKEGKNKDKRFNISKTYTNILSRNSNLKNDLESWRGVPFTALEMKGFELNKIVDKNCMLWIEHKIKGDRTYVNVVAVKKCATGMPPLIKETDTKETPKWIIDKQSKAVVIETKKDDIPGVSSIGEEEIPF